MLECLFDSPVRSSQCETHSTRSFRSFLTVDSCSHSYHQQLTSPSVVYREELGREKIRESHCGNIAISGTASSGTARWFSVGDDESSVGAGCRFSINMGQRHSRRWHPSSVSGGHTFTPAQVAILHQGSFLGRHLSTAPFHQSCCAPQVSGLQYFTSQTVAPSLPPPFPTTVLVPGRESMNHRGGRETRRAPPSFSFRGPAPIKENLDMVDMT